MVEDKCLKQVFSVTDSDGNLSLLVQRYFIRILQYDTFKGMKLNAINVWANGLCKIMWLDSMQKKDW